MPCGCMNPTNRPAQSQNGCGCGGHPAQRVDMLSRKKKIRILDARLKDLNEQKSDLEELIEELKEKS